MGAPRYKPEQDTLLLQLEREHGEKLEEICVEYLKKFPKPSRTAEQLRRHLQVLRQSGTTAKPKRKAVIGQLQRITAWLVHTAQRADAYRAARDQLMAEVRKLRGENRAFRRANDQLAGQLAKVKKIAAMVEGFAKSPRVEAAKVQHSKD